MKKNPPALAGTAQAAIKSIATAATLLCAGLWQEGYAQTAAGAGRAAPETRNLQAQAASAPGAHLNSAQRCMLEALRECGDQLRGAGQRAQRRAPT